MLKNKSQVKRLHSLRQRLLTGTKVTKITTPIYSYLLDRHQQVCQDTGQGQHAAALRQTDSELPGP